jgi:menaquinone-dependent protoporphyrinogen oxidase
MFVLVGYASAHGSTQQVAERIAERLRSRGVGVEALPLDQVRHTDRYDAVVLGSAIHDQAWLPQARQFVQRNAPQLAAQPVWLFSVGMPGALAQALRGLAAREGPKILADLTAGLSDDIKPRDHRLFSGVVRAEHLPKVGRLFFRALGGRYGDFRNWQEIDTWAEDIARALSKVALAATA